MNLTLLKQVPIFDGIENYEMEHILSCLKAKFRQFNRGEIIYHMGDHVTAMGIVLKGSVIIENNDVWGHHQMIEHASAGQIFAETYACVANQPMMVDVIAAEPSEVLFLDIGCVMHTCGNACRFHQQLIQNLLDLAFKKNLMLSRKIINTSAKSIRGRLLSYLSQMAVNAGKEAFTIPFNRQQLADYLGVDRSALSRELGRMQEEGLLEFDKNRFILKGTEHWY